MRTRSDGLLSPKPASWQRINQYGVFEKTVQTITANVAPQQGVTRTMTDVDTPGFHRRKSQGVLVINTMTSERRSVGSVLKPMAYYVKYTPPNPNVVWTGSWTDNVFRHNSNINAFLAGGYSLLPAFSSTDAGIALASAYSSAASPDAATLVTLGEMQQTLSLLQAPVDMLLRRTRVFDRLREKMAKESRGATPAELLQELSNLWLTARYGVIPLVLEAQGLINALQRTKSGDVVRQTSRGFLEVSDSTSRSIALTTGPVDYYVDQFVNWRISYRAGVTYDWVPDLAARFGLRPADVPQAALELVPLSFVAEWFVNASNFLGALTFHMRAKQAVAWYTATLDGTVSTVFNQGGSETTSSKEQTSQSVILADASGSRVDESVLRRTRLPATISDIRPGIRVKLNTARLVDAFSLLYQRTSLSGFKNPRGL